MKFDIVIGNPPYVDSKELASGHPDERRRIAEAYPELRGNWDLYVAFFWLGWKVGKGVVAMIASSRWMACGYGLPVRRRLCNCGLASLTRCRIGWFDDVLSDFMIFVSGSSATADFRDFKLGGTVIQLDANVDLSNIGSPWLLDRFFSPDVDRIRAMERSGKFVSDVFRCEGGCTTSEAYAVKPELHDGAPGNGLCKAVNTGTIAKFGSLWGKREMRYLGSDFLHPVASLKTMPGLVGRSYVQRIVHSKVIVKGLGLLDAFTDANGEFMPCKSTVCVLSDSIRMLKAVCVLLNSSAVKWYLGEIWKSMACNGGMVYTKNVIGSAPLPVVDDDDLDKMVWFHDSLSARFDEMMMARCDSFVMGLYGI